MKIEFTRRNAEGHITSQCITAYGDEPYAFDDVGGYYVDDLRSLKVGESMEVRRLA